MRARQQRRTCIRLSWRSRTSTRAPASTQQAWSRPWRGCRRPCAKRLQTARRQPPAHENPNQWRRTNVTAAAAAAEMEQRQLGGLRAGIAARSASAAAFCGVNKRSTHITPVSPFSTTARTGAGWAVATWQLREYELGLAWGEGGPCEVNHQSRLLQGSRRSEASTPPCKRVIRELVCPCFECPTDLVHCERGRLGRCFAGTKHCGSRQHNSQCTAGQDQ